MAESNYSKVDGESLGVMSMILANKTYLYGVAFQAITDHKILCPLNNSTNRALPTMVARHLSKLGGFDFELVYEPGSMTPSDYGSCHTTKSTSGGLILIWYMSKGPQLRVTMDLAILPRAEPIAKSRRKTWEWRRRMKRPSS